MTLLGDERKKWMEKFEGSWYGFGTGLVGGRWGAGVKIKWVGEK
jgi:hypothetical protein